MRRARDGRKAARDGRAVCTCVVRNVRTHTSMKENAPVRFVAPDHTTWTVHEISERDGRKSLLFASPEGFRRVRVYPAHWRTLSHEELWALSWTR
jgi:hypothetical protein